MAGPIIGAFATIGISEFSRLLLGEQGGSLLVYGVILVVSILYMPKGIYGTWLAWRQRKPKPGTSDSATVKAATP